MAIVLVLLAFVGINMLDSIYPVPKGNEIPEVYQWLSSTDYESVLELPMYTWTDRKLKKHEYYRLYYSLFHQKQIVNGVSGFMPKETAKLLSKSRSTDSIDQIIDRVKFFNPELLIIHKDQQLQASDKNIMLDDYVNNIVWEDSKTIVIKLR